MIRKNPHSTWLSCLIAGLFVLGYSLQLVAQFAHHHHGAEDSSICSHGHDHDHEDDGHDGHSDSGDRDQGGEERCCASCAPSASELVEALGLGQVAKLVAISARPFSVREYLVVEGVYHPPRPRC